MFNRKKLEIQEKIMENINDIQNIIKKQNFYKEK